MRPLAGGSIESSAAERIVMVADPLFTGRMKLPEYVAPGASRIVSPGCALFRAACRLPPLGTEIVAARAAPLNTSTSAHAAQARANTIIRYRFEVSGISSLG